MIRYDVDWSDAAYPQIVRWNAEEGSTLGYHTFAEAKAEIVEYFQCQIQHAREQIKQVRATKRADL